MTDDTPTDLPPYQRAAVYLAERVRQLRAEIKGMEARVNEGFGAEVLPLFRISTADWLEILRADLLEAEGELEFLRAKIEGLDE